jgi:hypothetical protein
MGTKISEMQATGSAPSGSHLAVADNSQNYKLPSQSFAKTFLVLSRKQAPLEPYLTVIMKK